MENNLTELKTKLCSKCGIEKLIIEFSKNNFKKAGLQYSCKACKKEYNKNYNKINFEKIKENKKQYYDSNAEELKENKKIYNKINSEKIKEKNNNKREKSPMIFILKATKKRAKKYNLEFNLNVEFLKTLRTEFCPIFGIKLEYQNNKSMDNSASLDRIDNNIGYIKKNIRIISYKANRIKNNGTKEEFYKLIKFYSNPQISNNKIINEITIEKLKKMFWKAKNRAPKYNRNFTISFDDLKSLYTENCPVFGISLLWNNQTGKKQYNFPSLDRIDNSKGYEIGNCVIVSDHANIIKNNATFKELKLIHDKAFEPLS